MLDLIAQFASIEMPPLFVGGDDSFVARHIPGYARHRLGRDASGGAVLLVSATGRTVRLHPAPTTLEHLTVQYDAHCRILQAGTKKRVEEGLFTVIRCVNADRALQQYFLQVAGSFILSLGVAPSRVELKSAVDNLIELFRAMSDPARKSVQGLWAELLLVAHAADPVALANAWRVESSDRFDFSDGTQRIEVKSAGGGIREHHFALRQLCPPTGTNVIIASLLVGRAGGGLSLVELVKLVHKRLRNQPALLVRIDRIIAQTLGDSWRLALESRFDREAAIDSLVFFDAACVPSPNPSLPSGVRDVRFISNLTGLTSLKSDWLRQSGGIFKAALPK